MKSIATLVAAVLAAVIVGMPSTAAGHAALEESNPTEGARLNQMPSTVSITLNEAVRAPAYLVVTDKDGARLNSDRVQIASDGKTAVSQTKNGAKAGDYSLSYRMVSEDSHAVTGTIKFTVLRSSSETPTPSVPSARASTPTPTDTSTPPIQPKGGNNWSSMLTVLGFFVLAMTGLVLFVRAGLKSSSHDEDTP